MDKLLSEYPVLEYWVINLITESVAKQARKRGESLGLTPLQNAQIMVNAMRIMDGWLCEKFPILKD